MSMSLLFPLWLRLFTAGRCLLGSTAVVTYDRQLNSPPWTADDCPLNFIFVLFSFPLPIAHQSNIVPSILLYARSLSLLSIC